MSLKKSIKTVLKAAQANKACHQQKIKVLLKHFQEVPVEQFFDNIKEFLALILSNNTISTRNVYMERVLEFLAQFVAEVTPVDDIEDELLDVSPHPFLTMIIKETLKYHPLTNESLRYNSCLFVKLILQHIGNDKNLDNEVCDMIQEAMLERTLDPKSSVRLQSVSALIRLQDPINAECPVIRAYLSLIVDPNPQIRTEVVKSIAPTNATICQIINRLRDIDHNVRMAAFRRCADIGPRNVKIIERQHILNCGLTESNQKVKNVFTENLLPKWLHAYDSDYINFLKGLKLDADENDITNTENVTKNIITLLLNTTPIQDIIKILPLTEEKIIPANKLTSETAVLWNLIVCYLRETDTTEDFLEQIIPDLTPFCNYIKSFIKEQGKNKMEDWEFLDYQYILNNLFVISEGYDLADEMGRRTLHQIILDFLRTENLQCKFKKSLVELAYKSSQKTDDFTSIICHIISDIQECFVEKPVEVSSDETNKECHKAELRVKIIRIEADLEDALDNQDFLKANTLKSEINQLKDKLNELSITQPSVEMVKVTKDDPKTICDCLDLLISLMELPKVSSMTPSLLAIKDGFVIPLLNSHVSEINWRVLECLVLFCFLEQSLAEEYIKVICIPIITYRTIVNYNRQALMISVNAVSDLYRLYGGNIFGIMEDALTSNHSMNTTSTKRKLYRSEDSDESITLANRFHLETIIEVILDMLDDEISEIRNTALEAIAKLILNNFPVSPLLITRLVLKWYNPLTARSSDRLAQLIGVVIGNYAKNNEDAKEVIAKAIIPILQSIASAPRTSPLADVDVDNLMLFLSTITISDGKWDLGTHVNMAHMFTYEILKTKHSSMVLYLSKMLLHLEISTENVSVMKELIAKVDAILESETPFEKVPQKNLRKFKEILTTRLENMNKTRDTQLEVEESTINEENKENDGPTNNLNQSKRKIPNNEKTISNLSAISEEDSITLEQSENNEDDSNSMANQAKRNKTNSDGRNETNTNSPNKTNPNSDSTNKTNTETNNPNKVNNESSNENITDSPNKSSTNTDSSNRSNTDSTSKTDIQNKEPHRSETSDSTPIKNPKPKKKRNRRLRRAPEESEEQSSTTTDDEIQQLPKRVKVIVHRVDIIEKASSVVITGNDKRVEDVTQNLQVQIERMPENGNDLQSELSKSTSEADVISASSNSQELGIVSKLSKRKRSLKSNSTKDVTSDSDTDSKRPKRTIRANTNSKIDKDKVISVVLNGVVGRKENEKTENDDRNDIARISKQVEAKNVGRKESEKNIKDCRNNGEQCAPKQLEVKNVGRKESERKAKDDRNSIEGRGSKQLEVTNVGGKESSDSDIDSRRSKRANRGNINSNIAKNKVVSSGLVDRKGSEKKETEDRNNIEQRVSKQLEATNVDGKESKRKEKDGRNSVERRGSKQLEVNNVLRKKSYVTSNSATYSPRPKRTNTGNTNSNITKDKVVPNGLVDRKESEKKENESRNNIEQRVSKRVEAKNVGKESEKKVKDCRNNAEQNIGRKGSERNEKESRNSVERRGSKQLEVNIVGRKESQRKEKDGRNSIERLGSKQLENIVITDKNYIKESIIKSNLRSGSKRKKLTPRELFKREAKNENNRGRKLILIKSTHLDESIDIDSNDSDVFLALNEISQASEDDVFNTSNISMMSRRSNRSKSRSTPVPKKKLNASTEKEERQTRKLKKKV